MVLNNPCCMIVFPRKAEQSFEVYDEIHVCFIFLWSSECHTKAASKCFFQVDTTCIPWMLTTYMYMNARYLCICLCFSLEILLLRRYSFVLMLFHLYWMNKDLELSLKPCTFVLAQCIVLCRKFWFEAETSSVCNIPLFGPRKPNDNICNSIFYRLHTICGNYTIFQQR